MKKFLPFFYLPAAALWTACAPEPAITDAQPETRIEYPRDAHSLSVPSEVAVRHLMLNLRADFDRNVLSGSAAYTLEQNGGDTLVLDVRGLVVDSVFTTNGEGERMPSAFDIAEGNERGDALRIVGVSDAELAEVWYTTAPDAAALMWNTPEQTHDKKSPFLFTQGQAILTRSWIPIQDSPAIRITYEAEIHVPEGMMALMSASNPTEKTSDGVYRFEMLQPVPPYLMALAAGDFSFAPLGERTGVYAEPGLLDAAAYEFADTEKMLETAEALYGPYVWGRYDILVLPPAFPFGGMENPRLTFVTPTIIAGDRSLTGLIAHELAHSWSGNLVTNATWDDFWLNEGFTVYFEKRIMEALYGRDYAEMLNVLGYTDLKETLAYLGPESPDTRLKLDLDGRDPDAGMTDIAYEKGYLFLRWLEELFGRENFDTFLAEYFSTHAFQTMTTERFIEYLDERLFAFTDPRPDVEEWIYRPGLPETHPVPESDAFDKIDAFREAWEGGEILAQALPVGEWSTHEWLHFLRGLPESTDADALAAIDRAHGLTGRGNSEIAFAWYMIAVRNDYRPAFGALEKFLTRVGRRKFIKPLYEALSENESHKAWAREVYREARDNYHSVTASSVDEVLEG